MPAFGEIKGATNLGGIVRGDEHQGVVFQRVGKSLFCAVVTRPGYAARVLLVDGLGLRAPIRVQPNLAHVGERTHERAGEAGEIANRLQGNGNGNGRFHHHVAIALAAEIQQCGLPGEHSAFWCRNNTSEPCGAPGIYALLAEAGFTGSAAPGCRSRTIFRAARDGRVRTSFTGGYGSRRNADVGKGIDEAGIDDEAFAFDDPSFVGNGGVLADGFDHAARDDDRGIFQAGSGDGYDRGSANGEILRFAALRGGARRPEQSCPPDCDNPQRKPQPLNRRTHSLLQSFGRRGRRDPVGNVLQTDEASGKLRKSQGDRSSEGWRSLRF